MRLKIGVALAASLVAGATHAHAIDEAAHAGIDWDSFLFAWIVGAALLYLTGFARMGALRRARLLGRWRAISFLAGIASLLVALLSPLDALADQLFSAHMAQHLVLLLVAPSLLVLGRPYLVWLWAFDLRRRRRVGRALARLRKASVARFAVGPTVVWAMLTIVLWFWHLPAPYGWALANSNVHLAEHLCFFFVSIAFWHLVAEPYRKRRMGYGVTMIYVASIAVQNGLLGALLTFANHPLYAAHLGRTAAYGLTALEDQQLAGVIMWVPASAIHLAALSVLFVKWLDAAGSSVTGARTRATQGSASRASEGIGLSSALPH
jgi:cytochrome c oxidase assembly factor CtaG